MRTAAAWVALCVIWSTTWLVIKVGLLDLPPLFFAGARFLIAFFALGLLVAVRRTPLPARADWPLVILTGVLTFGVNYGCIFWGEQHVASGLASIVQATIPAFGMIFAHYQLSEERMSVRKVVGLLLGLVGVGVIFSNRVHSVDPLAAWGTVAILCGALSVAYSSVLIKARGAHLEPATLSAGQMLCGFVPLLAASYFLEGNWAAIHWTSRAIFSLFYLALAGSALTFCLYYWLVQNTEITKVMTISLITPVAAVGLGILVLGEKLSWRSGAGAACVLLGTGLIIVTTRPPATVPADQDNA